MTRKSFLVVVSCPNEYPLSILCCIQKMFACEDDTILRGKIINMFVIPIVMLCFFLKKYLTKYYFTIIFVNKIAENYVIH
jgi:hypothetical protein